MGWRWRGRLKIEKIVLLGILLGIFLMTGIFLPTINYEFGKDTGEDYSSARNEIDQLSTQEEPKLKDVLKSVALIFLFTFGALPIWLEAIFIIARIMFYAILVDLFWLG